MVRLSLEDTSNLSQLPFLTSKTRSSGSAVAERLRDALCR